MQFLKVNTPPTLPNNINPYIYHVLDNDVSYPPEKTMIKIDSQGGISITLPGPCRIKDPDSLITCNICNRTIRKKSLFAHRLTNIHKQALLKMS